MKKIILMGVIVLSLTGCETLRYSLDKTFSDESEYGMFQSNEGKPVPTDNLVASADDWIKRHLW